MRMSIAVCGIAATAVMVSGASADQIRVLDHWGNVFRYDTATGEVTDYRPIQGLATDERVVAIDTGPVGRLYGLTAERLYEIDALTGDAVPAGPRFAQPLSFPGFATVPFDFRPDSPLARVLVGTGAPGAGPFTGTRSLTIDAETMAIDEAAPSTGDNHQLAYAPGDEAEGSGPLVTAMAYRNDPGGLTRSAFGIDAARGTLVRVGATDSVPNTPESLTLTTVAPLSGLKAGATPLSLEILTSGTAVLLATGGDADPLATPLYAVDLGTGELTALPSMGYRLAVDVSSAPAVSSGPARTLDVVRSSVVVDLRRRDRDSAAIVGRIEVPQGGWEGTTLRVDFGGVVREFVLDARGRGTSGRDSFKVSRRPKQGGWQFTLRLRRGDFRILGIRDAPPTGTVDVVFDLFAASGTYRSQMQLDYYVKRAGRAIASKHAP